jgi:hypothetical protein
MIFVLVDKCTFIKCNLFAKKRATLKPYHSIKYGNASRGVLRLYGLFFGRGWVFLSGVFLCNDAKFDTSGEGHHLQLLSHF